MIDPNKPPYCNCSCGKRGCDDGDLCGLIGGVSLDTYFDVDYDEQSEKARLLAMKELAEYMEYVLSGEPDDIPEDYECS